MSAEALGAVLRARSAKVSADLAYLDAIALARSHGATYAEIGRAAGVTRQAVRNLLLGHHERLVADGLLPPND